MKTATVWIEDAAFALLFRPHRGAFDISTTGNFPSKEKRDANAQELAREGGGTAQLDLTDALQIIFTIFLKFSFFAHLSPLHNSLLSSSYFPPSVPL